MHGFFPTGANRMARRIILNHPSISGKNLPATEALLAKSWVNVIKCDHRGRKCSHRIFGRKKIRAQAEGDFYSHKLIVSIAYLEQHSAGVCLPSVG